MWMRPLAIAALALLFAPFLYAASPALGGAMVAIAAVASAWAFGIGVLPRVRRKDAYDLGELRRVHEAEEIRSLDPDEASGLPDQVVCPRCFEPYPYRLGACPNCGSSR